MMTTRNGRRCAALASTLLAAGGAAGYVYATLAGAGLIAGLIAISGLSVLTLFALTVLLARNARQAKAAPVAVARRLKPGDILIPIEGPAIDEDALVGLRKLGGESFVDDVVSQFVSEGVLSLLKIAQAAGEGNAQEYASQVHALRSSAANVGARRLYKLCLEWRDLPPDEVAESGSARFVLLQKEFAEAERMLKARGHGGRAAPAAG